MAIAVWVFYQVVLMVVFSRIEALKFQDLGGELSIELLIEPCHPVPDNLSVSFILIVDAGTILVADVVSLPVDGDRVDDSDEEFDELLKGDDLFVIDDFDGLGGRRSSGFEVFIGRLCDVAVGIAHGRAFYASYQGKEAFDAPEAAAGKIYLFHIYIICQSIPKRYRCAYAIIWIEMYSTDYDLIIEQIKGLAEISADYVPVLANASALLYEGMKDLNWAGFYLVRDGGLLLGPFQGKVACVRIEKGKGVCGTALEKDEIQVVDDVHQFPGHIACDSASNSEVVIPIHANGKVVAVLDIDSPVYSRFSEADVAGLKKVVSKLEEMTEW